VVKELEALAEPMVKWPNGFGNWLGATDLALSGAIAVVLVEGNDEQIDSFASAASQYYLPTMLLLGTRKEVDPPSDLPLFDGKTAINGTTTGYVCRNFTCERPATTAAELREQLTSAVG
jgi:uncharacterized protein YyaL (SSP411 family)